MAHRSLRTLRISATRTIGDPMKNDISKLTDFPISRRTFLKAVGAGTAATLFGGRLAMAETLAAMPTLGIVQLGSCNGCQVSLLELGLDLKTISSSDPTVAKMLPTVNIVYAPLLVDALESKLDSIGSLDMCLVEGVCGSTVESTGLLKRVRSISKKVITVGNCASYGGVCGLMNTKKNLLKLSPVSSVIKVDGNIQGCPPNPEHIWYKVSGGTIGQAIQSGTVCDDCIYMERGGGDAMDSEGGLGRPGCKTGLGCKGPSTPRCATQASGGKSQCLSINDMCIGCYHSQFPFTPYKKCPMND